MRHGCNSRAQVATSDADNVCELVGRKFVVAVSPRVPLCVMCMARLFTHCRQRTAGSGVRCSAVRYGPGCSLRVSDSGVTAPAGPEEQP